MYYKRGINYLNLQEFLQVFDEVLDDSEQDEWRTLQVRIID